MASFSLNNKKLNIDFRPISFPKWYMKWVTWGQSLLQFKAYRSQRAIEKALFEDESKIVPFFHESLSIHTQNDLLLYQYLLLGMLNKLDKQCNFKHETTYSKLVYGAMSFDEWIKKEKLTDKSQRAKLNFRKSFNQLKQSNIEVSALAAKKAFKLLSCSSLYFWHFKLLSCVEHMHNLLHILVHTKLLITQLKRVKYYRFLRGQCHQIDIILKVLNFYYSKEELNITKQCFHHLKDQCKESIIKDQTFLDVSKKDHVFLNEFVDYCSIN